MRQKTRQEQVNLTNLAKILSLSPAKASKLNAVKRWIRQSSAVLVMMLSSSQILYAYICEPDSLARSYLSFLIVHGGIKDRYGKKSRQFLECMGSCVAAGEKGHSTKFITPPLDMFTPIPFKSNIPSGLTVDLILDFATEMVKKPQDFVLCSLTHPDTSSCIMGAASSLKAEFFRAFAMYGPLTLIMSGLFRGQTLLKSPKKFFIFIIKSIIRSSIFLTCYCSIAWYVPCVLRNIFKRDARWMYYLNGLLSGSMVLLEAPGRRLELALYCAPRAIESFWNVGVKAGWFPHVVNGELIYFSTSIGFLMSMYNHDPESIEDGYRKLMFRFIGVN